MESLNIDSLLTFYIFRIDYSICKGKRPWQGLFLGIFVKIFNYGSGGNEVPGFNYMPFVLVWHKNYKIFKPDLKLCGTGGYWIQQRLDCPGNNFLLFKTVDFIIAGSKSVYIFVLTFLK